MLDVQVQTNTILFSACRLELRIQSCKLFVQKWFYFWTPPWGLFVDKSRAQSVHSKSKCDAFGFVFEGSLGSMALLCGTNGGIALGEVVGGNQAPARENRAPAQCIRKIRASQARPNKEKIS